MGGMHFRHFCGVAINIDFNASCHEVVSIDYYVKSYADLCLDPIMLLQVRIQYHDYTVDTF